MEYAAMILERITKYGCWEVCHALLEESGTVNQLAERTGLRRQVVQTAVRQLHDIDMVSRIRGKNPLVVASQPELLWDLLDAAHTLAVAISTERAEASRRQAENWRERTLHWEKDLGEGEHD